ncbi:MAG: ParB/RepB/Spo0J family partition protein [Arcobacteraceae bacterium]|nr:ParB/RepB/Spo0J family partition protein [Arcobacteraceae bacterium]
MKLSAIDEVTKDTTRTTGVSPFMELQLELVYPNPNQPRKLFDKVKLQELANSIETHGLLEPIVVVKDDNGKYMIIAGERRYKASLLNDARTIKTHIIKADIKKVQELALIENIQRDDLTDYEIAKHIGKLWDTGDYDRKKDLADVIGKSDTYLSRVLSVLKLDEHIISQIERHNLTISLSVLDEISRVKDVKLQNMAFNDYLDGKIKRDDIKHIKNRTKEVPELWEKVEDKKPKKLNRAGELEANVWFLDGLKVLNQEEVVSKLETNKHYKYSIKKTTTLHSHILEDENGITFQFIATEENIKALKGKSILEDFSKEMSLNNIYTMTIDINSKRGMFEKKDYLSSLACTNENGRTWVICTEGDFEGTLEITKGKELIKNCSNHCYEVILKEIDKEPQIENDDETVRDILIKKSKIKNLTSKVKSFDNCTVSNDKDKTIFNPENGLKITVNVRDLFLASKKYKIYFEEI